MSKGTNMIFGEGSFDAKICLIGEAPGETEVLRGRPFVGKAGELLMGIMQNVGISRTDCYITNVVKERPPNNDISVFIKMDNRKVTTTDRFDSYLGTLYKELSNCNANVFVPLGAVPLYALTNKLGITKWRGSILTTELHGRKIKTIPCIHPSAALRQYLYTYFIQNDLRRVKAESETPDINLPQRDLRIHPSYDDACAFLNSCLEHEHIAFDIEVMREEVSCISFAVNPFLCMSIPFQNNGMEYFTVDQEMVIWRKIATILEDDRIIKIGQNLSFDATFLHRKLGIRVNNMVDSMIAQGVIYPDFPKGLDFLCSIYTREPYYKDDGKKWKRVGISEDDFWIYNAKDSACTYECYFNLLKEARDLKNTETVTEQTKLLKSLVYMQSRGIPIDVPGMRKEGEALGKEITFLSNKLNAMCGKTINHNSPKQLAQYFYMERGAKPYTKKGSTAWTTDETALKRLARKGFAEASVILELRAKTKLKSTYLDMVIDDDNRMRCSFNPVGAKNGRLSSSKTIFDTGGNMQNLPQAMLKFLHPDTGYIMYNVDLSQGENRVVAYIAPEPAMIKAFEEKKDVHAKTAGLIFNKDPDIISDVPGSCELGGGMYSERFWGKKANHGLNYDMGYKTFALKYELPEAEAKFIVERYHMVYPGVRRYHAWIRNQLGKGRTLENPFGRKRLFLDRWGDPLFKEAYNWIPSSTIADIINRRGLNYIAFNPEIFSPIDLLNQVHDSIVFQISLSLDWNIHAKCLIALKHSLEQPIHWRGTSFVIGADMEMGLNLSKPGKVRIKADEHKTVGELADHLDGLYGKLRASNLI